MGYECFLSPFLPLIRLRESRFVSNQDVHATSLHQWPNLVGEHYRRLSSAERPPSESPHVEAHWYLISDKCLHETMFILVYWDTILQRLGVSRHDLKVINDFEPCRLLHYARNNENLFIDTPYSPTECLGDVCYVCYGPLTLTEHTIDLLFAVGRPHRATNHLHLARPAPTLDSGMQA